MTKLAIKFLPLICLACILAICGIWYEALASQTSLMPPDQQFFDNSGKPLAGGKVYTCYPGTACGPGSTTLKPTYQGNSDTTALNTNPIILDASGRGNVWLNGFYKIAIYDALGNLIRTRDNIPGQGANISTTTTIIGPPAFTCMSSSTGKVCVSGSPLPNGIVNPDDHGGLAGTVAYLGSTPATVYVSTPQIVGADLTIPPNVSLVVAITGSINYGSHALTINGPWVAPLAQVLYGSGTVTGLKESRPEWWGAKNDGTTDSTSALNSAFASGAITNLITGTYRITGSLYLPAHHKVRGLGQHQTYIKIGAGTYTQNYALLYNSSNGFTWDVAYPYPDGEVSGLGFTVDGSIPLQNAIFVDGGCLIENVSFTSLNRAVTTSQDYTDQVRLESLYAYNMIGPGYAISINQLGDAFSMRNCHIDVSPGPALAISGTNGAHIDSNIINGQILVQDSNGVVFTADHTEGSAISIVSSRVSINGSFIQKLNNAATVVVSNGTYSSSDVKVSGTQFVVPSLVFPTSYDDITVTGGVAELSDTVRAYQPQGALTTVELGSAVVNGLASNISNRVSSAGTVKYSPDVVNVLGTGGSYNPLNYPTSSGTWVGTAGTYYYHAQLLHDINRLAGVNFPYEASIAATSSSGVSFPLYPGTQFNFEGAWIALYRGTASGSYNAVAYIPAVQVYHLYDNGQSVNGYSWQAFGPSAEPTLNSTYKMRQTGAGNVEIFATAAPTVGVWVVGDHAKNSAPAVGQPKGWICTVGGTPGTWVSEGNL